MRYLTLSADHREPSVRDDLTGELDFDLLSEGLASDLRVWNDEYQPVIPLDPRELADEVALIARLDRAGVELARRIAREFAPAKVTYFSEGSLGYVAEFRAP